MNFLRKFPREEKGPGHNRIRFVGWLPLRRDHSYLVGDLFRHILHVTGAVLLWVVFVLYWRIVAQRPLNPETKLAIMSLAVLSFLTILYLGVWVYHNVRIFQKEERRKAKRRKRKAPLQDYLGRWIVVDNPESVQSANYIEVEVRGNVANGKVIEEKVFRAPYEDVLRGLGTMNEVDAP